MLRRTLTILSLIGLLLSAGLWGASYLGFFWRSPDMTICFGAYEGAAQFSRLGFTSQEMEPGWPACKKSVDVQGADRVFERQRIMMPARIHDSVNMAELPTTLVGGKENHG